VGAKVIASGDGSWELELELPQEPPSVLDEQNENAGPRLGWGWSPIHQIQLDAVLPSPTLLES